MTDEAAPQPKKKRKKGKSPTSRALDECKKRGYVAGIVERFVSFPPPGHRVDYLGCIDIIAITPSGMLGIQATSGSNHSAHVHKIHAEPKARLWIEAGNRLEVWTFSQHGAVKRGARWDIRVERIAAEDCATEVPSDDAESEAA